MVTKIERLDELLKDHIHGRIVKQEVSRLTAPGENYGSLMLKVDVTVQKEDGEEEIIHSVAKCVPPNKQIQEMFDTANTFKYEIAWYTQVIPTMLAFQKEKGIINEADFFTKFINARLSLDPNQSEVQEDAVILFENLNALGYINADRITGFNLEESQTIIKKLAEFHAISLSIKKQRPEVFNAKIRPYLSKPNSQLPYEMEMFTRVIKILQEEPETSGLASKAESVIKDFISKFKETKVCRETWASATHADFWVNNIMIKRLENQSPKIIILDLQTCEYGSILADLVFFLGVSVENTIFDELLDDLLKLYFDAFVNHSKALGTDCSEYSWENYLKELNLEARDQFIHCMFFVAIVLAEKGKVSDIVTVDEFDVKQEFETTFSNINAQQKQKYVHLVKQFSKRNWI